MSKPRLREAQQQERGRKAAILPGLGSADPNGKGRDLAPSAEEMREQPAPPESPSTGITGADLGVGLVGAPRIARYSLQEEVGSGGMSVVYRAVDSNLGRDVAVKVLHRHLAGRKEERSRFRGEAQAVARLHHPNILEIFDYSGPEAADTYIVSEFIRGPTLRQFEETVGMGLPEIGALVAERIASALDHAHEQGVIHRDVKPENVMIQDDGAIKLTDFGIARMVDRDERMTQTGSLLGSPAHMPPEIVAGEPVDHRADVFSLGTVLYWMVCGVLPYAGSSPAEILRRIMESDYQDPRAIDPRVSDELAAIIRKAMARRPEDRHGSAALLQAELADYLANMGFGRCDGELAAFFSDPASYKRGQRARLIDLLMERGRRAIERRETASALAAFDRVLALQPGHEGAKEIVERLRRRRARWSRLAYGAATSVALAAMIAVAMVAPKLLERSGATDPPGDLPGSQATGATPATTPLGDAATATSPGTPDPGGEPGTPQGDTASMPGEGNSEPSPVIVSSPDREAPSLIAANPGSGNDTEPRVVVPSPRDRGPGTASTIAHPAAPLRSVRILLDTWADISIDGERIERDREARRDLPAGRYILSIARPGFVPIEEPIEVVSGEEVLELRHRLVPQPAVVRIINDQRAAVSLNDKLIGPANPDGFEIPIAFPELPDGRFEYPTTAVIRIEKPGYLEQVHRLQLRPGQLEEITASLEPEA